ncbi:MAG TPA: 4Fe-4S binding protein [Candidatus Deferrimicrobium sp.]|nr:4Fe-4S binding protein [Candidatus Deferrimicrobium sp.]
MKIKEEDSPYVEMIKAMNREYPIKFPISKKSLELVKIVYSPEQAKLLSVFKKPFFDQLTPKELAKRSGLTKTEVKDLLEPLAEKGVVMKVFGTYALLPIVPGLFEFYYISSHDTKENLIKVGQIFDQVAEEGFLNELIASKTPFFRALPSTAPVEKTIKINETLKPEHEILPFEVVKDYVKMAHNWAVVKCACRTHNALLGNVCERTSTSNCMALDVGADWVIERGWGQKLTYEEALALLEKSEKEGLVHTIMNTSATPILICNCCPCHCGILNTVIKTRHPRAYVKSNFFPQIDAQQCKLCNKCVQICPMNALFHHYPVKEDLSDEYIEIIKENCIGCGVCATNCPQEAISMIKVKDDKPPANIFELFEKSEADRIF